MPDSAMVAAPVQVPELPFPGIDPYRYSDRHVFSGRNSEAQSLLRLVVMYRGVLLFSASGIGKSSLVNAGLIPLALKEGYQPHRVRVQPRCGEEIVIERLADDTGEGKQFMPSIFIDDDHSERISLSVQDFSKKLREGATKVRPFLIFDQFEEWATLFEESVAGTPLAEIRAAQESIGNAISAIIKDRKLPVKILISLREDYLAKLTPLFKQVPSLPDQYLRLTPLKGDQIYDVIRQPFEAHPGQYAREIDSALAREIQRQFVERSSSGEIRLTELQIVCRGLFESGVATPELLRFFKEQHEVQGILERYLEHALDSLGPEQREPALYLLSRMVTSAGTRNVIYEGDLLSLVEKEEGISRDLLRATLNNLEEKTKLIRHEPRRDVYYYEISSEFLIGWIQQKSQAHEIINQQKKIEQERLAEQEKERQQQKALTDQRKRKQQIFLLTAGLLALAVLATVLWRKVVTRSREAREAQSSELATRSMGSTKPDPDVSLWLAIEAAHQTFQKDNKLLQETADALSSAVRRTQAQYKLQGRMSNLSFFAFSPDGSRIATADDGENVKIWNGTDGSLERTLEGHSDSVTRLAFDAAGARLATASEDQSIRIWDVASGNSLVKIPVTPEVWGLMFSSDGSLLAAVLDTTKVKVWNTTSGQEQLFPDTQLEQTFGLKFSPDWDMGKPHRLPHDRTGYIIYHDNPLDASITARTFSPDGQYFATALNDGTVKVVDSTSGKELFHSGPSQKAGKGAIKKVQFEGSKQSGVRQICFSPDGSSMAVSHDDGTVEVLGSEIRFGKIENSQQTITDFAFSPDGMRLAMSSQDGTVTIWKASKLSDSSAWLSELALSEDGSRAVGMEGSGQVHTVKVWDTSTPYSIRMEMDLSQASPSPGGSNPAPAQGGSHQYRRRPKHLAISPDGNRIAVASETSGDINVWQVKSKTVSGKPIPAADVNSLEFSHDGTKLLTSSPDGSVKTWDIASGSVLSTWSKAAGSMSLSYGTFADDGAHMAAVSSTGSVSLMSSAQTIVLTSDQAVDLPLRFSPSGRWLATTSATKSEIELWDVSSGTKLRQLSAETGTFGELAFSPVDENRVATILLDRNGTTKIVVWDVAQSRAVQSFTLENIVSAMSPKLAFTSDGHQLIALTREGVIESLVMNERDLMSTAEGLKHASATTSEACAIYKVPGKACDAAALAEQGLAQIQKGDLAAAETSFQKLQQLDPKREEEARQSAVENLVRMAKDFAEREDLSDATKDLTQAKKLRPDLKFDPEAQAKHWEAKSLLRQARNFESSAAGPPVPSMSDKSSWVEQARDRFNRALALDPAINLSPNDWNSKCWFGSLMGHAKEEISACQKAVELDPDELGYRDSRGVARAMTGDFAGAIQDFQAYIQGQSSSGTAAFKAQRKGWIASLRAGKNPFTPQVVNVLMKE